MTAPVEFHPRLVEEAVWTAIRGRRDAGVFHRDRERLYAGDDGETRERLFARFHAAWFERLDLASPVRTALEEQAAALAAARRVLFVPETGGTPEGAELFVARPGEFSVVVALGPRTLADGSSCLALLRRELLHVADMLDPEFRYEPRLPRRSAGPAHDRRLQDRYRALWSCSVDGRLARLGRLDAAVREERLREFRAAFPSLADAAGGCFDRVFSGPRPGHPDLVAIAEDPRAALGLDPEGPSRSGPCPLCGFPAAEFEPEPSGLPAEVLEAIGSEFPSWRPERGLCPLCADLYRSRNQG